MKKMTQIESGNFSTTKAGNFTGYSSEIGKVFIPKALMASKSWAKNEEVKFPFFALVEHVSKVQTDLNGKVVKDEEGNTAMIEREQAASIFTTYPEMLNSATFAERSAVDAGALVSENKLAAKLKVREKLVGTKFDEATINELLTAI